MKSSKLFSCALFLGLVGFCGMICGGRTAAEDNDLKEDYRRLDGFWETQVQDAEGRMVTITKSEHDRKSIVTAYDVNGNVVHSHTSDFELKRVGDVKVFRYTNRTVTKGPQTGVVQKEPREYIYKIVGDRLYEIQGAMTHPENQTPSILVWKRAEKSA